MLSSSSSPHLTLSSTPQPPFAAASLLALPTRTHTLLHALLRNVSLHPKLPRVRKIRFSNKLVQKWIRPYGVCITFLCQVCGFEVKEIKSSSGSGSGEMGMVLGEGDEDDEDVEGVRLGLRMLKEVVGIGRQEQDCHHHGHDHGHGHGHHGVSVRKQKKPKKNASASAVSPLSAQGRFLAVLEEANQIQQRALDLTQQDRHVESASLILDLVGRIQKVREVARNRRESQSLDEEVEEEEEGEIHDSIEEREEAAWRKAAQLDALLLCAAKSFIAVESWELASDHLKIAIDEYERRIRLSTRPGLEADDERIFELWFLRGQCSYERKRYEEALQHLERAKNIKPNDFLVYYYLVRSLFALHRFALGEATASEVLDFPGKVAQIPYVQTGKKIEMFVLRGQCRGELRKTELMLSDFRTGADIGLAVLDRFESQGVLEMLTREMLSNPLFEEDYYRYLCFTLVLKDPMLWNFTRFVAHYFQIEKKRAKIVMHLKTHNDKFCLALNRIGQPQDAEEDLQRKKEILSDLVVVFERSKRSRDEEEGKSHPLEPPKKRQKRE